ncbi:MAG: universal stress protein [Thermomicrobia bacterium]|nr:universal stress protein [Thermomicrobia bacterium]MCA1725155.1 universal stress protein [Thermomicrobia bacterium]
MASHGRGGILRWALGSTVEGVLTSAPCPVVIVRAGTVTADEAGRAAAVSASEDATGSMAV